MNNIKKITFTALFVLINTLSSIAYTDTTTFDTQRAKVNALLDERTLKFGEYDKSLEQKTGIFGLFKSKNDMQRSIDILQEIVKTDNKIFIETRNLLKIKDNQAEQYQQLAVKYDNQVTAYMKTISKLQGTHDSLQEKIRELELEDHGDDKIIYILTLIIIILLVIIGILFKRIKTQKLTKL